MGRPWWAQNSHAEDGPSELSMRAQHVKQSLHRVEYTSDAAQHKAVGRRRLPLAPVSLDPHVQDSQPGFDAAVPAGGASMQLGPCSLHVDVPLGLRLTHSQRACKWPDLRLHLIQLSASWPGQHSPGLPRRHRKWHNHATGPWFCPATQLAKHTAAMALAYILFPDIGNPLVQRLAKGAWWAFGLPAAWQLADQGARQQVSSSCPVQQPEGRERTHNTHSVSAWALGGQRAVRALQLTTGPAALLRLGAQWATFLAPSFSLTCEAVVALLAVMFEYNHLGQQVHRGRIPAGLAVEEAWHAAHKRAARRVARYLRDLPPSPPLGPLLHLAESASLLPAWDCSNTPTPTATWAGHSVAARTVGGARKAVQRSSTLCLSLSIPLRRNGGASRNSNIHQSRGEAAHSSTGRQAEAGVAPSQTQQQQPPQVASLGPRPGSTRPPSPASSHADAMATLTVVPAPTAPKHNTAAAAHRSDTWSHVSSDMGSTSGTQVGSMRSEADSRRGRQGLLSGPASSAGSVTSPPGISRPLPVVSHPPPSSNARMAQGQAGPIASATHLRSLQSTLQDEGLMLFGRADHAQDDPALTVTECAALTARAVWLITVFAPFLTLGAGLLLFSTLFSTSWQRPQLAAAPDASTQSAVEHAQQQKRRRWWHREGHRSGQVPQPQHPQEGSLQFHGSVWAQWARLWAWHLLLWGCRASGAAFIKWGQWSATRTDLFPPDFCDVLGSLHQAAPRHSAAVSRREVQRAFGRPLEELFVSFESEPIASGSVAQVHRATILDPEAPSGVRAVAVKVRHPGVAESIARDFRILKPIAGLTSRVRMLKGLSLKETLAQFSHTMTAQTDLRVEAVHLDRAGRNFAPSSCNVCIPKAVDGLVSPSVLVETWEEGHSLQLFCKRRTPINTQLVALGVDAYLSMLLEHNFVHTDLHPGNILVRMLDERGRVVDATRDGLQDMLAHARAIDDHHAPPASPSAGARSDAHLRPELVLIDYGLAEELTPKVRKHFLSFLSCIGAGNGTRAAHHLLHWSEHQTCPDVPAFTRAVEELFREQCDVHSPTGINLDLVMKSVLRLACVHELTIDSAYAALAVAVCVLVGFATSLDPGVNLMDAAVPCFLANSLTGRVMGRLY